ncbi:MAG TPA: hypothetical protein ACFYD4_08145 [Candidatus Wunengus sp. YC61]
MDIGPGWIIFIVSAVLYVILLIADRYNGAMHGFNEDGTYGEGHHDHSWH